MGVKREYQEQKYGSMRQHYVVREIKAVQSRSVLYNRKLIEPQIQSTVEFLRAIKRLRISLTGLAQ